MFKKIISLLLVTVMIFSAASVSFVGVSATDDTMDKLVSLIRKFPHGKYWNHTGKNNPDSVTDSPCASHYGCDYFGGCSCNSYGGAIQCMGFAAKLSYEITGVDRNSYEESRTLDVSKLRVGDIIRADGHSVLVTGVNGNNIAIAHCNYGANCIIRWETVNKSFFGYVEYVLHLKGNERTNTDIKWHDAYTGAVTPDIPEPPGYEVIGDGEVWKTEADGSVNVRRSPNTSGSILGSIPELTEFDVYDKSFDGVYLWARVKYNGMNGYCALNFAEYISGEYEVPVLDSLDGEYTTETGLSLSWRAVSGVESYKVSLYDKDKKLIKEYTAKSDNYKITAIDSGKYFVRVTATNSAAASWKPTGEMVSVTVKNAYVPVSGVSLRETGIVAVGESGQFKPTVLPAEATDKGLVWKSSNEKIATISADGTVTGVAPGKVKITCTSKENSKLSAVCELTVRPAGVTMIQTKSGTSESTVGLKWNESKGATGYTLYRYNEKTEKYVKIAEGKKLSYTDKNLSPGTKYTYAVKPYTVVGGTRINGTWKPVTAQTTPTAIKVIKQTGSDTGRVRVEWEKKEGVYAYVVFKYNPETKAFEKLGATTKTGFIDTGKPATKLYYRVVSAIKTGDGYAGSKSSPTVTAITGLEMPETKATAKGTSVTLSWGDVKYATHYQVFRVIDGKAVLLKTLTADADSYTDKNLKSGVTYTYYVRAGRAHSKDLKLYSSAVTVKAKVAKS